MYRATARTPKIIKAVNSAVSTVAITMSSAVSGAVLAKPGKSIPASNSGHYRATLP